MGALLAAVWAGGAACRCPPAACAAPAASPPRPEPTFAIESKVLGETRRINVHLPPGYAEDAAARYPVVYMPDGGMEEDFPHVADLVQAGAMYQTLRPLIVVGIENTDRRHDLTGPTAVEADRKLVPKSGGSAAFRAFLRTELMPAVRARYRTTDDTAIVGESLAGLFVVETFLLEPELFDVYLAFSPSLWWNDYVLVKDAGERLAERPGLRAALYLTSANEENIVAGTRRLADALAASAPAGLTWFYHPMPDEFHDTIYRASAPRAFRILFPAETPAGGS